MNSPDQKQSIKDDSFREDETARTNDQSNSFIESESKQSDKNFVETRDFDKESNEKVQTNLFGYSDGSSSDDNQISSNDKKAFSKNQVSPQSFYNDLEELD